MLVVDTAPETRRTVLPPPPVRIIVTGWRYANTDHWDEIDRWLGRAAGFARPMPDYSITDPSTITLVDGDCHVGGVDQLAHVLARQRGWRTERHPARGHPTQDFGPWPRCGPNRNEYMCSLGATVILGLPGPGSSGTWDCLKAAQRYGIDAIVHGLR